MSKNILVSGKLSMASTWLHVRLKAIVMAYMKEFRGNTARTTQALLLVVSVVDVRVVLKLLYLSCSLCMLRVHSILGSVEYTDKPKRLWPIMYC